MFMNADSHLTLGLRRKIPQITVRLLHFVMKYANHILLTCMLFREVNAFLTYKLWTLLLFIMQLDMLQEENENVLDKVCNSCSFLFNLTFSYHMKLLCHLIVV